MSPSTTGASRALACRLQEVRGILNSYADWILELLANMPADCITFGRVLNSLAIGASVRGPCQANLTAGSHRVSFLLASFMRCRYDMGMGVFSNPDGCGRGEGIVHLRITYTPFTMFQRHPAGLHHRACCAITQCWPHPLP